jgi:hypothetical protein
MSDNVSDETRGCRVESLERENRRRYRALTDETRGAVSGDEEGRTKRAERVAREEAKREKNCEKRREEEPGQK